MNNLRKLSTDNPVLTRGLDSIGRKGNGFNGVYGKANRANPEGSASSGAGQKGRIFADRTPAEKAEELRGAW